MLQNIDICIFEIHNEDNSIFDEVQNIESFDNLQIFLDAK